MKVFCTVVLAMLYGSSAQQDGQDSEYGMSFTKEEMAFIMKEIDDGDVCFF